MEDNECADWSTYLNLNFHLLEHKFTDCYNRNEIISFYEMCTAMI